MQDHIEFLDEFIAKILIQGFIGFISHLPQCVNLLNMGGHNIKMRLISDL